MLSFQGTQVPTYRGLVLLEIIRSGVSHPYPMGLGR